MSIKKTIMLIFLLIPSGRVWSTEVSIDPFDGLSCRGAAITDGWALASALCLDSFSTVVEAAS